MLLPPIQVHSLAAGSNFQKSFRKPGTLLASEPFPPKSQSVPSLFVQVTMDARLPGLFPAAAVPSVPYTPGRLQIPPAGQLLGKVLLPLIQAHSVVVGSNFHRSFRSPSASAEPTSAKPVPPKSQKLPSLSTHAAALSRAPGTFPGAGVLSFP